MNSEKSTEEVAYRNQAAQRVLSVLSFLIDEEGSTSVSRLEAELSLSRIIISRALDTLESAGFVISSGDKKTVSLGYRVLGLSNGKVDDFDIRALCHPYLIALHELTGESVFLSIIAGDNRVPVEVIEAKGPRVAHSQRGLSVPLHVGKTSRTLLAFLDDQDIEDFLRAAAPIDQYVDFSTASKYETVDDVWKDIQTVRRDGSIMWHGAEQFGALYLAFPLLDRANRPHAAITIGGPRERFSQARAEELLPQIRTILRPLQERARLIPASPIFVTREHS
ncbi:IclR family transcriptional regulator [Caballeronia turbans]|jgi:DNA-binding IclR family transcriptional regulator|uniref:IclR family transcriptional regulator n=1 Tax=unclassified Caballeronia TaxID=2646786 RepID=UPI00074B53AF|nr:MULTISPECIES: IclR family transcriptional regulator C-terminal domain-containing protein [unclassified Caballeronia]SAL42035.1 IclR family transcriptional regulator [Caballeronia turbans]